MRITALLDALQNLWSTGRQSRFLADLTPKFVAAALTSVKAPIFLESVQVKGQTLNSGVLDEVLKDHEAVVIDSVMGVRSGLFEGVPEGACTIGEAFVQLKDWVERSLRTKRSVGHASGIDPGICRDRLLSPARNTYLPQNASPAVPIQVV